MKFNYKNKHNAFTLSEVMILLLVLSILLAAFAPVFTKKHRGANLANVWQKSVDGGAYYNVNNTKLTATAFIGLSPATGSTVFQYITDSEDKTPLYSKLVIAASDNLKKPTSDNAKRQRQISFINPDSKDKHPLAELFAGRGSLLLGGPYNFINFNENLGVLGYDTFMYNTAYGRIRSVDNKIENHGYRHLGKGSYNSILSSTIASIGDSSYNTIIGNVNYGSTTTNTIEATKNPWNDTEEDIGNTLIGSINVSKKFDGVKRGKNDVHIYDKYVIDTPNGCAEQQCNGDLKHIKKKNYFYYNTIVTPHNSKLQVTNASFANTFVGQNMFGGGSYNCNTKCACRNTTPYSCTPAQDSACQTCLDTIAAKESNFEVGNFNTLLGNNIMAYENASSEADSIEKLGTGNTAVGNNAFGFKPDDGKFGDYNTAIGYNACSAVSGSYKTCIGFDSGAYSPASSSALGDGTDLLTNDDEAVFIGGSPNHGSGGIAVVEVYNPKEISTNSANKDKEIGRSGNYIHFRTNTWPINDTDYGINVRYIGAASVVINGDLIVRGQTYLGARPYLYDDIGLIGFKYDKANIGLYAFMGDDGTEASTLENTASWMGERRAADVTHVNCTCAMGSSALQYVKNKTLVPSSSTAGKMLLNKLSSYNPIVFDYQKSAFYYEALGQYTYDWSTPGHDSILGMEPYNYNQYVSGGSTEEENTGVHFNADQSVKMYYGNAGDPTKDFFMERVPIMYRNPSSGTPNPHAFTYGAGSDAVRKWNKRGLENETNAPVQIPQYNNIGYNVGTIATAVTPVTDANYGMDPQGAGNNIFELGSITYDDYNRARQVKRNSSGQLTMAHSCCPMLMRDPDTNNLTGRRWPDYSKYVFRDDAYNARTAGNPLEKYPDYIRTSDIRLKNLISPFESGLANLKRINVYNFTFKNDKLNLPQVGVMAQDLKRIFPNAVTKGDNGYYKIRWDEMFYSAIDAIKTLNTKIENLATKIASDQARISALKQDNKELNLQLDKLADELTELEQRKNK